MAPQKAYLPLATAAEDEKLPLADDPSALSSRPSGGVSVRTFVIGLAISFLLPVGWFMSPPTLFNKEGHHLPGVPEPIAECTTAYALPVSAPKKNIWANIDIEEATSVRRWLHDPAQALNLTRATKATDSQNSIYLIEAFVPPKGHALSYLNSTTKAPHKYAHAVIHHGAATKPYIQDYLIGPLPIGPATTIAPLRDVYHVPEIPFNARGWFSGDMMDFGKFVRTMMAPLDEACLDLFGAVARGLANDTLVAGASSPSSFDGEWRRIWLGWKFNVPGSYLFPVDFYTYLDVSGNDASLWHVRTVVYNEQIFNSSTPIDEFLQAWKAGTLVRSKKPTLGDEGWADRSHKGGRRDLDHLAGPKSVSMNGPRFRVDEKEQYLTWMGWALYLGFERDMGLSLWDINFRGERIIYELSPQEAMAQYSGNDPHQASTVFLDRGFGMGSSVKELLRGYDCPDNALMLPATVHNGPGSSTRLNAICVFEQDSGKPLSRHTGWMKNEMGAVKGYELVIRSVSTVGNYDYLFDYTFMLDGTMEVRLSASGYLQGAVWSPDQDDYGTQIRDNSMGSLHDHIITYKVDFDVAGTRNSFMTIGLEMQDKEQKWFGEDWGTTVRQQSLKRKLLKTEDEGRLNYPPNLEGLMVVVNEEEKNAWGNSRGYAIHPGMSPIHLTNLESKRTLKNVQFAKNHVSVSQRKDTEQWASTMWNIHLPGAPTIDFDRYFDHESLEQEDLVVWLNLGMHHIPRAEDAPHTLTNVATSSVLLTPFNFNDYDVGMESLNAVLLQPPEPGFAWKIDQNGIEEGYCLPAKPQPLSYTGQLSYDEDGAPASAMSIQRARMAAEQVHGIWAGTAA